MMYLPEPAIEAVELGKTYGKTVHVLTSLSFTVEPVIVFVSVVGRR